MTSNIDVKAAIHDYLQANPEFEKLLFSNFTELKGGITKNAWIEVF